MKRRNTFTAVTSAILALIILTVSLFATGCNGNKEFDYLESDLSEYIEFTESYKNFKLEIDIAKPRDLDIDVSIINMLCEDKNKKPLFNGAYVNNPVISVGDVVNIYYRGYLIGDDGEHIEVTGMSNFSDANPYALEIGGNGFIPGFEYNLIGVDTKNYPKFEKITSGEIKENQIAYISYTRTEGDNKDTKVTESYKRIPLSGDVDAILGEGIKQKLLSIKVGNSFDTTAELNGKTYSYTNLKVNFVTECEVDPIVVESYFPYDYNKTDLRNETAYFEVYVENAIQYEAPEFTDEYLTEKLEKGEINLTLEELKEYDGETLVDKYYNFAKETMQELYEETYRDMVEQAVWDHLYDIAKVKKYPTEKVQEIYDDYVFDIINQFKSSGGQIYNNTTYQYDTYQTLDTYATAYLGITDKTTKWRDVVYKESEAFVKQRLVMYYVLRNENLVPSEEKFDELYDELYQEYLDEAILQYMYYDGNKTEDDYTEEEYEDLVEYCKDVVATNFDSEHFAIKVYYRALVETIVEWPEVVTLDERRAYPQDK